MLKELRRAILEFNSDEFNSNKIRPSVDINCTVVNFTRRN